MTKVCILNQVICFLRQIGFDDCSPAYITGFPILDARLTARQSTSSSAYASHAFNGQYPVSNAMTNRAHHGYHQQLQTYNAYHTRAHSAAAAYSNTFTTHSSGTGVTPVQNGYDYHRFHAVAGQAPGTAMYAGDTTHSGRAASMTNCSPTAGFFCMARSINIRRRGLPRLRPPPPILYCVPRLDRDRLVVPARRPVQPSTTRDD